MLYRGTNEIFLLKSIYAPLTWAVPKQKKSTAVPSRKKRPSVKRLAIETYLLYVVEGTRLIRSIRDKINVLRQLTSEYPRSFSSMNSYAERFEVVFLRQQIEERVSLQVRSGSGGGLAVSFLRSEKPFDILTHTVDELLFEGKSNRGRIAAACPGRGLAPVVDKQSTNLVFRRLSWSAGLRI